MRTLKVVILMVLLIQVGKTEERKTPWNFKLSSILLDNTVKSKYDFDDAIFASTPVWWSTAVITLENDKDIKLWLEFFSSQGLREDDVRFDNELDLTVGTTWERGNWSAEIAFLYIDTDPLFDDHAGNVTLLRTKIKREFDTPLEWVKPHIRWAHRTVVSGPFTGGNVFDAVVKMDVPVKKDLVLSLHPTVWYNDGHFGTDPGFSGGGKVGLQWQVSKNTTFSMGANFLYSISGRKDLEEGPIFGISLTHLFNGDSFEGLQFWKKR